MPFTSGRFYIKLLLNAAALVFTDALFKNIWLSGTGISSFVSAVLAVFILGIVNIFIRPSLVLLTLPINILTLGIFTILINALMFKLTSVIVPGFHVVGFWTAIGGSLVFSILSVIINRFFNPLEKNELY